MPSCIGEVAGVTPGFEADSCPSLGRQSTTVAQPPPAPPRCVLPEEYSGIFDMTAMYSCPTLFSFPHFYLSDDRIVNSTGERGFCWCTGEAQGLQGPGWAGPGMASAAHDMDAQPLA